MRINRSPRARRSGRKVLRNAGHREFGQGDGGFVVEGGDEGEPFLVGCADDEVDAVQETGGYAEALRAAGYPVEPDPDDDQSLDVRLPWRQARPGTWWSRIWMASRV
jgi:hypothetical protein